MKREEIVKSIVEGSYTYFRLFRLANNIHHHTGNVEWIYPAPGTPGPRILFNADMGADAQRKIDEVIGALKGADAPFIWIVDPCSRPDDLTGLLTSKGFEVITDTAKPEHGMALELVRFSASVPENEHIRVKRVAGAEDYKTWMGIVNRALNGRDTVTYEDYGAWLNCESVAFYLALWDGLPVCTVAVIRDGANASIEFVSTLEEYRRKGIAYAACTRALYDLKTGGAELVTLRADFDAHTLYLKLGFSPYYAQTLLRWPRATGAVANI